MTIKQAEKKLAKVETEIARNIANWQDDLLERQTKLRRLHDKLEQVINTMSNLEIRVAEVEVMEREL